MQHRESMIASGRMSIRLSSMAALLLLAPAAFGAECELQLKGKIEPVNGRIAVHLFGSHSPFSAATVSDTSGRFHFHKLLPGSYTVSAFVTGHGDVRRTVEVTPAFADSKGCVSLTIRFDPSGDIIRSGIERHSRVSVKDLSIPDKAVREYGAARKKLQKRDIPGAIAHLERAVKIAPQFVAAWNNLGTIAYQSARYTDAERYFREALKHDPDASAPIVNLGGTLLMVERSEEALPYNRRAVEQEPTDALANSQLGLNYFLLGNDNLALEYLNKAKEADPSHFSFPQLTLARIYLRNSNPQAAAGELEDFLVRHPDVANAGAIRRDIIRLRNR